MQLQYSYFKSRTNIIILLLAIFNIVFHLVFYNTLEYHRDELLYFALGMHPAFGYATTPPLMGFLAYGLIQTIGYSLFAVKILPALLSGLMVILTASITKEMGGKKDAQILSSVAVIIVPFTMRVFSLFHPVHIGYIIWAILFYYFLRYLNTERTSYLYFIGITIGIGLLNKYLIVLPVFAMILFMVFSKQRKLFCNKHFYFSIILAVLVFSPNLIWQLVNGFPAIHHMLELKATQLVHVDRVGFLIEQFFTAFPVTLLMIPGFVFLLFSKKMKEYRILAYVTLFVMLVLFLLRGKSYYTAGLIPVSIAAGAIFWEQVSRRKWITFLPIPVFVILIFPAIPLGLPVYDSDGLIEYFDMVEKKYNFDVGRRWEDGEIHPLPQDYADMIGWEELAKLVHTAYEQVEDKSHCVIYGENYGQAGAVSIIGKKYGLPEAFSFHDSFRYWVPRRLSPDVDHFIYINNHLGEDIQELFSEIINIGSINNPYAREYGTTVYLCRKPKRSFASFYDKVLEREGLK